MISDTINQFPTTFLLTLKKVALCFLSAMAIDSVAIFQKPMNSKQNIVVDMLVRKVQVVEDLGGDDITKCGLHDFLVLQGTTKATGKKSQESRSKMREYKGFRRFRNNFFKSKNRD